MDRRTDTEDLKPTKADAVALGVLFAMLGAPLLARTLSGLSPVCIMLIHDVGFQWIPFREFINSSLAQGVFPLWSPQAFAGFPLIAFAHAGLFYPLGLLFLLGDYAQVISYFYMIHFCIAASGIYFFLRRIGLGTAAAWFASMTYMFTVKPFYFIHYLPSASSNVWIPWFMFGILSFLYKPRLSYLLMSAVFLTLQVLGGDMETTAYALLFLVPAAIILHRQNQAARPGRILLLLFVFIVAGLLSTIQLLPLIEYTRHFLRDQGVTFAYFSHRNFPSKVVWSLLFPMRESVSVLQDQPDIPDFYLGLLTLGLAGFAAVKRVEKSSRSLAILAFFVLVWALGSIPWLNHLRFMLPLFNNFVMPWQASVVAQVLIAILAGQAVQSMMECDGGPSAARAFIPPVLFTLAALCAGAVFFELLSNSLLLIPSFAAALLIILGLLRYRPGLVRPVSVALLLSLQVLDIYTLAFVHLPSNDPEITRYRPWLVGLSDSIRQSRSRYVMVSRQGLRDTGLPHHAGMALDLDSLDGWVTVPPRRYVDVVNLVDPRAARFVDGKLDHLGLNIDLRDGKFIEASSMPVLDLLSLRFIINRNLPLKFSSPIYLSQLKSEFHRRTVVEGAASDPENFRLDAVISAQNEIYRFRLYVHKGDALWFFPDPYHADQKQGPAKVGMKIEVLSKSSTETIFEREMMSRPLDKTKRKRASQKLTFDLSEYEGQEVELLLVTEGPVRRQDLVIYWNSPMIVNGTKPFQLIKRYGNDIFIYENREALPRAFVVHKAEVIDDDDALLDRLRHSSRAELAGMVLLEREVKGLFDPDTKRRALMGMRDNAVMARRRSGEEVFQVSSKSRGLLFISDQYYPGWRAFVEGEEVPILRANYCFRAVPVGPGTSLVKFVYAPADFRIGLFASMATILMAIIFMGTRRHLAGSKKG